MSETCTIVHPVGQVRKRTNMETDPDRNRAIPDGAVDLVGLFGSVMVCAVNPKGFYQQGKPIPTVQIAASGGRVGHSNWAHLTPVQLDALIDMLIQTRSEMAK